MQKDLKEQFVRCIGLMQKDVAEFEAKYQGRFAEDPHVGLGNRTGDRRQDGKQARRARDGDRDHRLALQELRRA